MNGGFEWILKEYGRPVEVWREGACQKGRALLQPILEKGGGDAQEVPTPLGRRRTGRFLYLGSAKVPVAWNDRVVCGGRSYRVRRAQAIRAGAQFSHWWAVVSPEDKEG
ncbi:hypothetical protein D1159_08800 [Pseudoflavonifractor sp. 524-17]|uniref:hypothetical protein n=1 Tax=Pseudoflavonifractor sp. 524-17 TaxID=2304577 RepID=UPI00137B0EE9|nr:hypothetical protein [Pseudoflavonifractor sp. 524-17]NCE64681.1 hypothetical protein [Pseudoflavonifractor sp. 524-17]